MSSAIILVIGGLTAAAYALFFLYDWLTIARPQVTSGPVFLAGFVLNTAAAAAMLITQVPLAPKDALFFAALAFALVSGALMIWSLFFALPKGTYVDPEVGRPCYKQGMYALCRHPGVLWYCLGFVLLAVALRTPEAAAAAAILCAGDLAYLALQDAWTFPKTFSDYPEYQQSTPLLIPTPASIAAALGGCSACVPREGGRP